MLPRLFAISSLFSCVEKKFYTIENVWSKLTVFREDLDIRIWLGHGKGQEERESQEDKHDLGRQGGCWTGIGTEWLLYRRSSRKRSNYRIMSSLVFSLWLNVLNIKNNWNMIEKTLMQLLCVFSFNLYWKNCRPTGGFFLAPAEGCSLRLQRWGPSGPKIGPLGPT